MKKQFEKFTDPHIKDILFCTALQLNIFYGKTRRRVIILSAKLHWKKPVF